MNEIKDLKLLLKEFKAELSTSGKEKQMLFFGECLHEIEHGINSQGVSSAIRLVAGSAKLAQFVDFTDVESKGTSEKLSLLLSFSENDSKTQKNS